MICLIINISIIVLSSAYDLEGWKYNLINIIICYGIIFFLPVIRGYLFFARTTYDLFAHLSWIKTILSTGHLDVDLIYPITHILTTNLILFGVPIELCATIVSMLFFILYLMFMYILGKEILKYKNGALMLLSFSIPLMYSFLHYAFIPFFFALCYIPLYLFCFHKRSTSNCRIEFSILTLILSLFLVFFHPLVGLLLIMIVFLFEISRNVVHKDNGLLHSAKTLLIISFVSFLTWYLSYSRVLQMFGKFWSSIINPNLERTTIATSQIDLLQASNANIVLVSEMFIKIYGAPIIYYITAFCCLVIIYKKIRIQKLENLELTYSLQFFGSLLFGIFIILVYSIIFEPIRAASFSLIIATIICGIVFANEYKNTETQQRRINVVMIAIIIISITTFLGVFNLYESPWKGTPGSHMTHMDECGLNWYLDRENKSIVLSSQSIYKYELYHTSSNNKTINDLKNKIISNEIPSHFGYDNNSTLYGSFDNKSMYMITSEFMRGYQNAIPQELRAKYPIYTDTDFFMLNEDPKVFKLYVNGEFEVWDIKSHI